MKGKNIMNGSWGEVWIDGEYMAEVKSFKAEVELEFEDINLPRELGKHKKLTGYEGTGEVVLYHVTSRMATRVAEDLQLGKQTEVSIISKLADPDALGHERILIKDAVLSLISLADWEGKTVGEKTIPFTFTKWQFLDQIDG